MRLTRDTEKSIIEQCARFRFLPDSPPQEYVEACSLEYVQRDGVLYYDVRDPEGHRFFGECVQRVDAVPF